MTTLVTLQRLHHHRPPLCWQRQGDAGEDAARAQSRKGAFATLVAVACQSFEAIAQTRQPLVDQDAGNPWVVPLLIALVIALLVAAFWNRRLAHEKRERRRIEQRLLDLTNPLPTCVIEYKVNPDGTIKSLFANPSAREMFRLPPGEHTLTLDDPVFLKHVHPDDRDHLRAAIRRSVDTLDPIDSSFQFMRVDGQYRWLSAMMAVRVMNDGALVWTGCIHDTTEQRQLESELQNMIASKDLFFTAASQELRKPIHVIGLALDQLFNERVADGASDTRSDNDKNHPPSDQPLQVAQAASQRLRLLIDDLLELAKVQRDDLPLRPGDFSLHGLLKALEHEFQVPFARKGLKLIIHSEPKTPDTLYGDHQRIHQVLANLINNALQHTHKGGVTIRVAPTTGDPGDEITSPRQTHQIRFSVTDTGLGMSAEQLTRIFEPFVSHQAVATDALARRTTNGRSDDPQGTGLGLAIGKRIVTRLGGTIRIESIPGSGTTAHVELPLETRTPSVLSPPSLVDKNSDKASDRRHSVRRVKTPLRQTRRILLVDDDRLGRSLMATLLESDGFQVTEVGNGPDALSKAAQTPFDAIITDLRMPGMDGITLARTVRELHTKDPLLTAPPRLIALSASLGGIDASKSSHDVFDVLLQKPVALAELVDILESPENQHEPDQA